MLTPETLREEIAAQYAQSQGKLALATAYEIPPDAKPRDGQKQLAIALWLAGRPSSEIAAECNISERTLTRWKASPEFRSEMAELADDVRSSHRDEMACTVRAAHNCLREIMADPSVAAGDRISAARLVLGK
jgi:hypothetical protein